jgi:hypothetical protein
MHLLTKSKYLAGLQCHKYLWTLIHEKDKIPKPDVTTQFKFDQGNQIGKLAKKLFPEGIDISVEGYIKNLEDSEKALKEKKPLFEAGFVVDNCFSRADILVPNNDKWDIIEVKSGTKVKNINIHDVSFQKYVYENKGIKIGKCFLLHLNNKYIRKGDIEIDKLFVKEDITEKVEEYSKDIKERITEMFKVINSKEKPKVSIGTHCKNPYACPCDCWEGLPKNHVFCLYRGGKLSCKLYNNGVELIKDIPDDIKLNDRQGIQKDCEVNSKIHVHKESIKHFLNDLVYPLYYLDFETFSTAIPKFDGLKPYSQVCFQFSLHVVEKEGSKPKHYEFLYSGSEDPRKEFVIALEKVLGNNGSIIVYNQSFEINRLKELGERFPSYKKWVDNVLVRVVDLLVPFRNFSYYNPKQQGSASIKKVLPALVGKDYSGMEISDGGSASVEFYNMCYNNGKNVREALLKYCCLDTLAEVLIVEKLGRLVK